MRDFINAASWHEPTRCPLHIEILKSPNTSFIASLPSPAPGPWRAGLDGRTQCRIYMIKLGWQWICTYIPIAFSLWTWPYNMAWFVGHKIWVGGGLDPDTCWHCTPWWVHWFPILLVPQPSYPSQWIRMLLLVLGRPLLDCAGLATEVFRRLLLAIWRQVEWVFGPIWSRRNLHSHQILPELFLDRWESPGQVESRVYDNTSGSQPTVWKRLL